MKNEQKCIFCDVPQGEVYLENDLVLVKRDKYPVSPGHLLVIPKIHVETWFGADNRVQHALMQMLNLAKEHVEKEMKPDGYNIGINSGEAAGQTVHHLHVHLIPRYKGDTDDPRGGVRWVVPGQAVYWKVP